MHQGLPYGLFSHGEQLTKNDNTFINHLAKKVHNLKIVHKLDNIKYTAELPGADGYVLVYILGDIFRVITYKQSQSETSREYDGIATTSVPMLFSGVFKKAEKLVNGEGVDLQLTNQCALRLGKYEKPVDTFQKLQRFRVPYSPYFQELKPEIASNYSDDELMFTQYGQQVPTWYSGAMSELMQIVAGYGRQDFDSLPDKEIERAMFYLPKGLEITLAESLNGTVLPGYSGMPPMDGFFNYDYGFYSTDLVSFDKGMYPWLVRVNSSGVWAMPLPMIPATTTDAFAAYVSEQGDEELLAIINRFKGIPSGEGFPRAPSEFHDWVRAGVIIKVCESSDFYQHSGYSTACGWSCNEDGTNLVNTCYDFENNYCMGYYYQINLNLGTAKNRGWIEPKSMSGLTQAELNRISQYLQALFELIRGRQHYPALIRYKIRSVNPSELLARASYSVNESELDYWRNLALSPIASHSGSCNRTGRGYLYGGVPIKLPEPMIKGCMSLNFAPEGKIDGYPKIDTIVYAYYIGNELKVIKNFFDERKFYRQEESTFEELMQIGAWEKTETIGLTGLAGNYYTSDFDDRREDSERYVHTKRVGKDLGYGSPVLQWAAFNWMDGEIHRNRYFETTMYITTVKNTLGLGVATIVPYLNRNALIYAKTDYLNGDYKEFEEYNFRSQVSDPNYYPMWTYSESQWVPWGMSEERFGKTWGNNKPYPKDGYPIWVEKHMKYPLTAENEYADEGPWLGSGFPQNVYELFRQPKYIPTIAEYRIKTEDKAPKPIYDLRCSIVSQTYKLSDKPHNTLYYETSPHTVHGNVVYEDACKVSFGLASYANISYNLVERKSFGFSRLADPKKRDIFLGVINE